MTLTYRLITFFSILSLQLGLVAQSLEVVPQTGHNIATTRFVASPDGKLAATASNDHLIIIYDLEAGLISKQIYIPDLYPHNLYFSPDNKYLLCIATEKFGKKLEYYFPKMNSESAKGMLFDTKSWKVVQEIPLEGMDEVLCEFHPQNAQIAFLAETHDDRKNPSSMFLWDISSKEKVWETNPVIRKDYPRFQFLDEGKKLFFSDESGSKIEIINAQTGDKF